MNLLSCKCDGELASADDNGTKGSRSLDCGYSQRGGEILIPYSIYVFICAKALETNYRAP
jgi:hypothetical protein